MSMTVQIRVVFEYERHADKTGVVPCASQQLDIDRLPVSVESRRKDHGRNAIRRTRRVPAVEA